MKLEMTLRTANHVWREWGETGDIADSQQYLVFYVAMKVMVTPRPNWQRY